MHATVHIREAQEDDSEPISSLLSEMGHSHDAEAVGANLRAIRALAPRYGTFVAVRDRSVVGVVSAFASPVLHRSHPVGRVSVLVVAQSFTGHGIGTALLLWAEAFLRDLGCGRIEVTSATHRQEAHEFYRRRGYTQQGIRFAREFDGRNSA
jgi:GNAT superfamily N-acetyltransferase